MLENSDDTHQNSVVLDETPEKKEKNVTKSNEGDDEDGDDNDDDGDNVKKTIHSSTESNCAKLQSNCGTFCEKRVSRHLMTKNKPKEQYNRNKHPFSDNERNIFDSKDDSDSHIDRQLSFIYSGIGPELSDPLFAKNAAKLKDNYIVFERIPLHGSESETFFQCVLYYEGLLLEDDIESNSRRGGLLRKAIVDWLLKATYGINHSQAENFLSEINERHLSGESYNDIVVEIKKLFNTYSGRTNCFRGKDVNLWKPPDYVVNSRKTFTYENKESEVQSNNSTGGGGGGGDDDDDDSDDGDNAVNNDSWGFLNRNSSIHDSKVYSNIASKLYQLWVTNVWRKSNILRDKPIPEYYSTSHVTGVLRYIMNLFYPTKKIDEDLLLYLYSELKGVPIIIYGYSKLNYKFGKLATYVPTRYKRRIGSFLYLIHHHHVFELLEPVLKKKTVEFFTLNELQAKHPIWGYDDTTNSFFSIKNDTKTQKRRKGLKNFYNQQQQQSTSVVIPILVKEDDATLAHVRKSPADKEESFTNHHSDEDKPHQTSEETVSSNEPKSDVYEKIDVSTLTACSTTWNLFWFYVYESVLKIKKLSKSTLLSASRIESEQKHSKEVVNDKSLIIRSNVSSGNKDSRNVDQDDKNEQYKHFGFGLLDVAKSFVDRVFIGNKTVIPIKYLKINPPTIDGFSWYNVKKGGIKSNVLKFYFPTSFPSQVDRRCITEIDGMTYNSLITFTTNLINEVKYMCPYFNNLVKFTINYDDSQVVGVNSKKECEKATIQITENNTSTFTYRPPLNFSADKIYEIESCHFDMDMSGAKFISQVHSGHLEAHDSFLEIHNDSIKFFLLCEIFKLLEKQSTQNTIRFIGTDAINYVNGFDKDSVENIDSCKIILEEACGLGNTNTITAAATVATIAHNNNRNEKNISQDPTLQVLMELMLIENTSIYGLELGKLKIKEFPKGRPTIFSFDQCLSTAFYQKESKKKSIFNISIPLPTDFTALAFLCEKKHFKVNWNKLGAPSTSSNVTNAAKYKTEIDNSGKLFDKKDPAIKDSVLNKIIGDKYDVFNWLPDIDVKYTSKSSVELVGFKRSGHNLPLTISIVGNVFPSEEVNDIDINISSDAEVDSSDDNDIYSGYDDEDEGEDEDENDNNDNGNNTNQAYNKYIGFHQKQMLYIVLINTKCNLFYANSKVGNCLSGKVTAIKGPFKQYIEELVSQRIMRSIK